MTYKKVDLDEVRRKAAAIRLLVLDVDGVMTDGSIRYDADGNEFKVFHVRDGYGIKQVAAAGITVAIISGRSCVAVEKRAAELGIEHVHLGVSNKLEAFNHLLDKLQLQADDAACVGDDVPDLEILSAAGLAVAVADAHPELDAVTHWHTHNGGGKGAVREVCDLLLAVQG